MDLIMTLDQSTLVGVRAELLRMEKEKLGPLAEAQLNFIALDDFCFVMLSHWRAEAETEREKELTPSELLRRVRMLCQLFDSVDVDSRGYISWSDLTNYCLRAGRIQLKENSYHSSATYIQDTRNLTPLLPIQKLFFVNKMQLLFAFDAETPTVFYFRRNGSHGRYNPLKALSKLLKLQKQTRLSYSQKKQQDKKIAETRLMGALFGAARAVGGAPSDSKGKILCMEYMERFRQIVFSSSDCYLTFVEVLGWEDGRESFHVMGHTIADEPQAGMVYSVGAELLLSWTGDASENHAFQVWDPITRTLRFQVLRHDAFILCACQITLSLISSATGEPTTGISGVLATSNEAHLIVSSSMDRKLILWSMTPLIVAMGGRELQEGEKFILRGPFHAIRSVCYAPEHELIVGSGFDFDIFAWSPRTRNLVLKLTGHINTVLALSVVTSPQERIVSLDERGIVKIWSIDSKGDKLQDSKGEMQSMQLNIPQPPKVYDLVAAFDGGRTIAAVAERVHFCRLDADATGDMRAVPRGLGLCERTGRVWLVSRRVVSLGRLRDGILIKRLCVFDDDRLDSKNFVYLGKHKGSGSGSGSGVDSAVGDKVAGSAAGVASTGILGTETVTTPRAVDGRKASMFSVSSTQMRRQSMIIPPAQDDSARQDEDAEALKKAKEKVTKKAESKAHLAMSYGIDPLDMITATVTDDTGKKTFIGTMDGHVLLFDSNTFGLLANLTNTLEFEHQRQQQHGSVVRLNYVARDELLVACFSGGALKVFIGIHRTAKIDVNAPVATGPATVAKGLLSSSSHLLSGSPSKSVRQLKKTTSATAATNSSTAAPTTSSTAAAASVPFSSSGKDGRPKSPPSNFPFPTGQGGKPPPKPELLRSVVLREKHALIFTDAVTSQDYNLIAVACKGGLVRVYDYINLDLVCAYLLPKAGGSQVEISYLTFLPHVPLLLAADLVGRITAWTVRPMNPAWVATWSASPPAHLDMFADAALNESFNKGSDIDSVGQAITCIQVVYYTEPSEASSVSTRNLAAAIHAVEDHDGSRRGSLRTRIRHATILRKLANRMGPGTRSGSTSMAATPGIDTPAEAAKRRGVWVILLGDDIGRLHCLDISAVVYKSGGLNEQFSPAAYARLGQPVYQKLSRMDNVTEHSLTSRVMFMDAENKNNEHDHIRAIGIDINKETPALNGINTDQDVIWVRKWWAHGDSVQSILVLQDERMRYRPKDRHERNMPDTAFGVHPLPLRPNFLFTTSDRGVVILWNWEGKRLGFIPDSLDEQHHDDEDNMEHAKTSSSLKLRGHDREEEKLRSSLRKKWRQRSRHGSPTKNANTIGDSHMTAEEYLKNFFNSDAEPQDAHEKGGWSLHMPHWGSKLDANVGVTQVLSAVASALEDAHAQPPRAAVDAVAQTPKGKEVSFTSQTMGGAQGSAQHLHADKALKGAEPTRSGSATPSRKWRTAASKFASPPGSVPMSPPPGYLQGIRAPSGLPMKCRPLDFIDAMVAWVVPRLQHKEKVKQWEEEKDDFNFRIKCAGDRLKDSQSGSLNKINFAATVQALLTGKATPPVANAKGRPLTPTQALRLELNEDSREFGASVSHASLTFDSQSYAPIFGLDMNEEEREKARIKQQMDEWAHALDENARVDEFLANKTDAGTDPVTLQRESSMRNAFRLNGKIIGVGGDANATFAYFLEKQRLTNFEQEIANGANSVLHLDASGKLGDADKDMKKMALDKTTATMLKGAIQSFNEDKEEKREAALAKSGKSLAVDLQTTRSAMAVDAIRQAKTNEFVQQPSAAETMTLHTMGSMTSLTGRSSPSGLSPGHSAFLPGHINTTASASVHSPGLADRTSTTAKDASQSVQNTGRSVTIIEGTTTTTTVGTGNAIVPVDTTPLSTTRQLTSRSRPQSAMSSARRPMSALSSHSGDGSAFGLTGTMRPSTSAAASSRPVSASLANAAARANMMSGWKPKTVKQASARKSKMDDILQAFDRIDVVANDNDATSVQSGPRRQRSRPFSARSDAETTPITETMISAEEATTGGPVLQIPVGPLTPIEEGSIDFSILQTPKQPLVPPDLPDRLKRTATKYEERMAAIDADKKYKRYSSVSVGRALREANAKKVLEMKVRQANAIDGVFDVVKARQDSDKTANRKMGGPTHPAARGRFGMTRAKDIFPFIKTLADLYEPHVYAVREMMRHRALEREQKQRAIAEMAAVQAIRRRAVSDDLLGEEETAPKLEEKATILDDFAEDPVLEKLREWIIPDDHRFSVTSVTSHPDIYRNTMLMEMISKNEGVTGNYDKTISMYGLVQAFFFKSYKGEWDRIFAFVKAAMFIREVLKIMMPPLPTVDQTTSYESARKGFFNNTHRSSRSVKISPSGLLDQIRGSFAGSSTLMMMTIKRTDSMNSIDFRAPSPKRPSVIAEKGSPLALGAAVGNRKSSSPDTVRRASSTGRDGFNNSSQRSIKVVGGNNTKAINGIAKAIEDAVSIANDADAENRNADTGDVITGTMTGYSAADVLGDGGETNATVTDEASTSQSPVRPSLRVSVSQTSFSSMVSPPNQYQYQYHQSPPRTTTHGHHIHTKAPAPVATKADGYIGWRLDHKATERLEELFDELYNQESGTVAVQDVIDMIHEYSSPERKGDSLDHLAHTMQVNGINLDAEVTGAIARKLFEVGLEVHLIKESELRNKSPNRARKLRLMGGQSFSQASP